MNDPTRDEDHEAELARLAERTAELRRQMAVEAPKAPPAADWLAATVPDILRSMQVQQHDAEVHAASCTERPCERCERFVCRCGTPVDGRRSCPPCSERERLNYRLKATWDSIPTRFEWACGASVDLLASRIGARPESIARIIGNPPSKDMLLMGPTRAGKTSLAVAMLDAWVRAKDGRRGAIFVDAPTLARARMRYRLGAGEPPIVEAALSAPLVLLDDLGREANDRDGCITDLIYGRHDASLPTWVTCGIDLPPGTETDQIQGFATALATKYDGGFVRRILEAGKPIRLGAR